MAKKSAIDKAIDRIEGKIAVLQAAVAELKQQQKQEPVRRQRAVTDAKSA